MTHPPCHGNILSVFSRSSHPPSWHYYLSHRSAHNVLFSLLLEFPVIWLLFEVQVGVEHSCHAQHDLNQWFSWFNFKHQLSASPSSFNHFISIFYFRLFVTPSRTRKVQCDLFSLWYWRIYSRVNSDDFARHHSVK